MNVRRRYATANNKGSVIAYSQSDRFSQSIYLHIRNRGFWGGSALYMETWPKLRLVIPLLLEEYDYARSEMF
jgi:hypothetical protein